MTDTVRSIPASGLFEFMKARMLGASVEDAFAAAEPTTAGDGADQQLAELGAQLAELEAELDAIEALAPSQELFDRLQRARERVAAIMN